MDRSAFVRFLTRAFFPMLRAEGFTGSGSTLRRRRGPVVHVFNLQGSKSGEEFFLNLGASLTFLGMHGLTEETVDEAKEYECAFRLRLHPIGEDRRKWLYPADEMAAQVLVDEIAGAWRADGQPWFARHGAYPEDFARLVDDDAVLGQHPARLLTLALIARQLGKAERCRQLVDEALPRVPERATGLRADLVALLPPT